MVDPSDSLDGSTVFVPRMCHDGATLVVAALRGVDVDARVCPEAGSEAWRRAMRYTTGDECYPQRVVLADLLEGLENTSVCPDRTALFLTTGDGPCRFGQYAPYLARTLRRMGLGSIRVLAPNSDHGYREVAEHAPELPRYLWWAVVSSDILRRQVHMTRPYEKHAGSSDAASAATLADLSAVLEHGKGKPRTRLLKMGQVLAKGRDRFRTVILREDRDRPLIGVVGEIFCRLNTFSNEDVIRRIEALGGEAWLSGVGEWVWYSNALELADLRRSGMGLSRRRLSATLNGFFQRHDERRLHQFVSEAFRGFEEPHEVLTLLELARPYLPWEGALGEMVLSVGKAVWLRRKGADGVLDVSPFGCMNGIISEAVYPKVSRCEGGIPIRNLYVDQGTSQMENGLELFLELARSYRRRRRSSGQNAGGQIGGERWTEGCTPVAQSACAS